MAQKNEYRLGIVGFGGMAQFHREEITQIPGIRVHGTYDIKEDRQEYAREFGLHVYESLEDMLSDAEIDMVLAATPNDIHKEIAIKAMQAGKHVICEKPVTMSSDDLIEMINVSEKTGQYFTVHQNRRWDEDYLTMKQIFESGKLGEVFRIESRVHGSRGIPGDWRQLPEHGGGMILDWGVHLLDQILLFTDQKVTRVYAITTHATNQLVDDGFYIQLIFESGMTAAIEVGTSNFISLPRWYMTGINGTAILSDWNQDAKIVSANGVDEKDVVPVVTAAGLTKTMAPRREDNTMEETIPSVKADVKDFYKNVMASIEGKEKRAIALQEVLRVMKLMEAAFESAKTGRAVEFEPQIRIGESEI